MQFSFQTRYASALRLYLRLKPSFASQIIFLAYTDCFPSILIVLNERYITPWSDTHETRLKSMEMNLRSAADRHDVSRSQYAAASLLSPWQEENHQDPALPSAKAGPVIFQN